MLAHHNAEGADRPQHRGAMTSVFELVIDLGPFVGTFDGRPAFVDEFPRFRVARHFRKQPRVVRTVGMKRTAVLGVRTPLITRASRSVLHQGTLPLLTLLRAIEAVELHLQAGRANGSSSGRQANIAVRWNELRGTDVEIDERLGLVMQDEIVDGTGIMSGIEQELFYRAQGRSLRKFNDTEDKTDGIVARRRMQSGIERQVVGTIGRGQGVEVVSVEIPFTRTVPPGIAVGLGVQARMVAIRKTAGTTITSRLAAGIGGGLNGHAVAGQRKFVEIPEQAESSRNPKKMIVEQGKQPIFRQSGLLIDMPQHPGNQFLNAAWRCGRRLLSFFLALLGFALASLLLSFAVALRQAPKPVEEVVKGADPRDVPGFEPAKDSIEAIRTQLIDPSGHADVGPCEEHEEIGTEQGSRIAGERSANRVIVLQKRSDAGQIDEETFENNRPIVFAQTNLVTGDQVLKLRDDKRLIIGMGYKLRLQKNPSVENGITYQFRFWDPQPKSRGYAFVIVTV